MGGEKGKAGYCIDVRRLTPGGTTDGAGGSSSPKLTPRARNFASDSSCTYASHSVKTTGLVGGTYGAI